MGQMQLQQEEASRHAFTESLLQQAAINTGSNLSDMKMILMQIIEKTGLT